MNLYERSYGVSDPDKARVKAKKKAVRSVRGFNAARALRCPACERWSALGKVQDGLRKCRYCGHWEKQS